jgi:hypothetical protein
VEHVRQGKARAVRRKEKERIVEITRWEKEDPGSIRGGWYSPRLVPHHSTIGSPTDTPKKHTNYKHRRD